MITVIGVVLFKSLQACVIVFLTARTIEAASTLIFLLMLILMAKGYTITRGRLSAQGSTKIAIFMTLYTISYIALFIYEAEVSAALYT